MTRDGQLAKRVEGGNDVYYVEDQDPILVKQEVELDQAELKRLYQEIMARFGGYVHRSYDSMFGPYSFPKKLEEEFKFIKDYHETPLGDQADGLAMTHYEYDEYVVPELARWIKALLEGDVSVLAALKKGKMTETAEVISGGEQSAESIKKAKQEKALNEMKEYLQSSAESMDGERFRQLSEQVMASLQEEPCEERLDELEAYRKKILACVKMRPVMTLYKDKWNELRRVYGDVKAFYEGTGLFEELLGKME